MYYTYYFDFIYVLLCFYFSFKNKSEYLWIIKMPIKDKPKSLDLMETIEEERRRTIEDIPNEILLKIFFYLTFNDNITAGNVCKRYVSRGQTEM